MQTFYLDHLTRGYESAIFHPANKSLQWPVRIAAGQNAGKGYRVTGHETMWIRPASTASCGTAGSWQNVGVSSLVRSHYPPEKREEESS